MESIPTGIKVAVHPQEIRAMTKELCRYLQISYQGVEVEIERRMRDNVGYSFDELSAIVLSELLLDQHIGINTISEWHDIIRLPLKSDITLQKCRVSSIIAGVEFLDWSKIDNLARELLYNFGTICLTTKQRLMLILHLSKANK